MTSFTADIDSPHVYYLGADNHVHELAFDGSLWNHKDLTAETTAPVAAPGSALLSFGVNAGSVDHARVYYLTGDNLLYELKWNGSTWSATNLTNTTSAPSVAPGTALAGYSADTDRPRVFYFDSLNHLHQTYWTGSSWMDQDLVDTVAATLAEPGSTLLALGVDLGSGQHSRIFYLDSDNEIHEVGWKNGNWFKVKLTTAADVAPGTPLSGYAADGQYFRLQYLDVDNKVRHLWWDGSSWGLANLTTTTSAAIAAPGSSLLSFGVKDSTGEHSRIYYLDGENRVNQLGYDGSAWSHEDVTDIAQ